MALTRREFLRSLAASAVFSHLARPASFFSTKENPFEFLVIGDSLIWGQGLKEKDKTYTLVADWLRTEAFGSRREVNLRVEAHSGATITFHEDEAEKYRKAGRDETYYYPPEINVNFPSMWKQTEVAADKYKAAGKSGADLVLISAGITDIGVSKVLDPFGDIDELKPQIERSSGELVFELLEYIAQLNHDALIVVVGYFPIISEKSNGTRLFNGWLESMSFPRFLKPLANNALLRKLLFGRIKKKVIERSMLWVAESDRNLQKAVDRINAKLEKRAAVFVPSPLTEDNAIETPDTLLFRMGKKGVVEDPLYFERKKDCKVMLNELKRSTGIEFSVRFCEIAGAGHPNEAGAKAYADAVEAALAPILSKFSTAGAR
ncbi:MAG: hypothetical protein ACRD6X_03490 [Pyrinomonadaceae bacterium]